MVAQILAYLVVIGITAILEIGILCISDNFIESDKIIWNIFGVIFGMLGLLASAFTFLLIAKCLLFCWSIIS